ncbi:PREDICTED: uncharacterized protein LOC108580293 [Habropoda laboriosa]|uniref:uncharacterized protein LOC108580293 n=1 Tax=Habropoda laboriosa TaxID=597456 RepID=UPI00083CACB4|nr:PREDICTED: uncharacterized protein LOC108580293 [Habropoda laboriosa]
MADEDCINPEFLSVLEEFTRIRDAYVALEAYHRMQEETLHVEQERSEKMQENLEKLSKTYVLRDKQYKSVVDELQKDNENLRKTVENLREQCDHLRLINTDRNGNDEQMGRLQDELEVLKAQILMQQEQHNEDVAVLKQKHSDEIQRYQMLLKNAKQGPASESKKRGPPENSSKSKNQSSYVRWLELNINKINISAKSNEETGRRNKRRKLFSENTENTIDIL